MLDAKDFEKEIQSPEPTLVKFGATWCMPCKMISPVLEAMSSEHRIMDVDVEQHMSLAQQWEITSVPTMLFFKSGKMVKRDIGVANYSRKYFENLFMEVQNA